MLLIARLELQHTYCKLSAQQRLMQRQECQRCFKFIIYVILELDESWCFVCHLTAAYSVSAVGLAHHQFEQWWHLQHINICTLPAAGVQNKQQLREVSRH